MRERSRAAGSDRHAERRLRSPSGAHRLLALRGRHSRQGSGEAVRRPRDAGGGDHRYQQSVRRHGLLLVAAAGGVQPIIGCQLVAGDDAGGAAARRREGPPPGGTRSSSWCRTPPAIANLLRLLALAYGLAEAQSDPRVPLADLCTHADGLIVLTGGPDGPVGRLLLEGRREAAEAVVAAAARGLRATGSTSSCCDTAWRARRPSNRPCWRSPRRPGCRSSPPTTPTSRRRTCTRRTTRCCASRKARTSPTPTAGG